MFFLNLNKKNKHKTLKIQPNLIKSCSFIIFIFTKFLIKLTKFEFSSNYLHFHLNFFSKYEILSYFFLVSNSLIKHTTIILHKHMLGWLLLTRRSK